MTYKEIKERIESLEFAKTRAKSPEELQSIYFELNRLNNACFGERMKNKDQKHLIQTIDFLKRFVGITDLQYSQYIAIDNYIAKKEEAAAYEIKK